MIKVSKWRLIGILCIVPVFSFCEFGKDAKTLYQEGLKEIENGNKKAAYALIDKASKKEPTNIQYQWAAAKVAPNQNDAYTHTKAAWDNGLKNPLVLLQLSSIAFHTSLDQKCEYALTLYKDLPDSFKSESFRGDIFFQFNKPDSSIAIWKEIEKVKPDENICLKIALAYEKKGDLGTMLSYLEQCRKANLLNSAGYSKLVSLWALQYDYSRVDSIYNSAVANNIADDALKIEYASVKIAQKDTAKVKELIGGMVNSPYTIPLLRLRAAVLLSFMYASYKNTDALKAIASETAKDTVTSKYMAPFCEYLLLKDTNTETSLEKAMKAAAGLPTEPYALLLYARELTRSGKLLQADSLYQRLPQVLLTSPKILTEYAYLKMRIGKDDDAMNYISRLHSNKIFTKVSLELFRDLAFKKKMFEKADAAQKVLEQKFQDDVKLQWQGAMLTLNQGKVDSSIILFTALAQKYPSEEIFEIMRLTAILLKGDYQKVIDGCDKSTLGESSKANLFALKARAYRKLQKNDEAKKAYQDAVAAAKENKTELISEYAGYLIDLGEQSKAASIYQELVTSFEKKTTKKDSLALAVMLNNFAWATIQSENADSKAALGAAKKAYALQPNSVDILDTYATVLLKTGAYKECINLLKDNGALKKEPRMLVSLGQAYEKTGDKNRAVRAYKDALAFAEGTFRLPLQINNVKLSEHIGKLQE